MIEFYGELSAECKNDRGKRDAKLVAGLVLMSTIILGVPYMILEILDGSVVRPIVIVSVLIVTTILVLLSHKIKFFSRNKIFPQPAQFVNLLRVTIDEQNISFTNASGGNKTRIRPIKKVRKVLDCGEWYYVYFKFGDISNAWVCQKDLLKKGTLEDFEKIFAGKIKRKKKISPIKSQ